MKIKTITCHNVYNVGASLQAYALVKYLENEGHDVEIIDYMPWYLQHYRLFAINNSKYNKKIVRQIYILVKFPKRIKAKFSKRKRKYDWFTKKYLPLTSKCYLSNKELKECPPEADIYFAGSDQIWNTIFQNGKDPAFYLEFAPQKSIRASYAASFATNDIIEEWKPQVRKWLTDMDYISVREKNGIHIIKKLGLQNIVHVLDPVFLLNKKEWVKIENEISGIEPYILLYDFDDNIKMAEYSRQIAKENDWKLYSIFKNAYSDKSFEQEGPAEFLWLVHHAEFIVSNSFHATAFSIIYEKQFVVFPRKEAINARMQELLKDLKLENQMLEENIDGKNIPPKINYDYVRTVVEKKIHESKNYISRVCEAKKAQ